MLKTYETARPVLSPLNYADSILKKLISRMIYTSANFPGEENSSRAHVTAGRGGSTASGLLEVALRYEGKRARQDRMEWQAWVA